MTDKTHSLSLKIDSSAARRGAAEFKGAITTVQQAVAALDRDTKGVFTALSKSAKLDIDTRSAKTATATVKEAQKATESYSNAARRTAISVNTAMRTSATETQRLAQRLEALGDTSGVAQLNAELTRLKTNLAAATSPLDVRQSRAGFLDVKDNLKRRVVDLEAVARAESAAGAAAAQRATELERLKNRYNPLYAASQQYETALNEIARAEKLGAISAKQASNARAEAATQLANAGNQMRGYGDAMRVAGHQSQNAAYQIQDVFVTAEMGMNPMRIALQQGSQLSMVMNDMARESGGAKGALTGLVTGITSMINPISLVTIGGIAAVAMLTQWAMSALSAGEETETFKDRLDTLSAAVSAYQKYADQARQSTGDLTARFGVLGGQAGQASTALATIGRLDAIRAADAAVQQLTERYGGLSRSSLSYADAVMPQIEATYLSLREEMNLTGVQAATVVTSLERLANAESMQAKIESANALSESFVRVFGSVEAIPEALLNVQREALLVALNVAEIEGAAKGSNEAINAMYGAYARSRVESDAALSSAQEMLASLRQQADMNQLIATYGRDSAQVAQARADAEREAYLETVNSLDVSESLKIELMGVWEAANGVASTDMTSPISSAGQAAAVLARNLGVALNVAMSLGNAQAAYKESGGRGQDPRLFQEGGRLSGSNYGANLNYTPVSELITQLSPPVRTRGGGGGGRKRGSGGGRSGAISEEAKAQEKLNETLAKKVESLEAERVALALVTSGQFESTEAAKLYAEAMAQSGGAVDAQTDAMIRQVDAATVLNNKLKRLAKDPVKDWVQSVPTWIEAGRKIETEAIGALSDTLSEAMTTGEFDIKSLGESLLRTVNDVIADMAIREMMALFGAAGENGQYGFDLGGKLQGLFGHSSGSILDPANGGSDVAAAADGSQAATMMQQAFTTGGQSAAAQMRAAITGSAAPSGTQMGAQVQTGASLGGTMMQTGISTSGSGAALEMQQAIMAGGSNAASQMGQATAGAPTGGLFGGFGGIAMSAGMMLLSSVLNKSDDEPADTGPTPEFVPVESYAVGTANTSGIPAMLHDNEAVIPLTGGRKVPVEMQDGGGSGNGGNVVHQTLNIQTQDADSFRRSSKQVSKDAYNAGQAAARGIG